MDCSDIRPAWLNVARRMQSAARSEGYSVLTFRVLVDAAGIPIMWAEPQRIKLEPRMTDAPRMLEGLLAFLTGGVIQDNQ